MKKLFGIPLLLMALGFIAFSASGCGSSEEVTTQDNGAPTAENPVPPTVFPLPGPGPHELLGYIENVYSGGVSSTVNRILPVAGGKIIVVGAFTRRIERFNADGSVDMVYRAALGAGANAEIKCVAATPDGGVIIGGSFSSFNGQAVPRLAKLDADGVLDLAFNAALGAGPSSGTAQVQDVKVADDGSFYVAGPFNKWSAEPAATNSGIHKFSASGVRDGSFTLPGSLAPTSGQAYVLALQPDGKVLVGARRETTLGGLPTGGLFRLNANGSADDVGGYSLLAARRLVEPGVYVRTFLFDEDGGVIIGGNFTQYIDENGFVQPAPRLLRLALSSGEFDTDFAQALGAGFSGEVLSLALQENGNLLVGGAFTTVKGVAAPRLVRLSPGLDVDETFASTLQPNATSTGLNSTVRALHFDNQGRLVVGGAFSKLNTLSLGRLLRLY